MEMANKNFSSSEDHIVSLNGALGGLEMDLRKKIIFEIGTYSLVGVFSEYSRGVRKSSQKLKKIFKN